MTYSHGYSQETSVSFWLLARDLSSCNIDLPIGLLAWPYDMAATFSRPSDPRERERKRKPLALYDPVLELIHSHFYSLEGNHWI